MLIAIYNLFILVIEGDFMNCRNLLQWGMKLKLPEKILYAEKSPKEYVKNRRQKGTLWLARR